MKQAVFVRKPEATLEENMDYVLNKMDYLLRKVENYDRALNEFNEIKLTIDEAKENTRRNKDIIREVKDSIDINSHDIKCLSDFSNSLSSRIEEGLEFVKDRIDDLDERTFEEHEKLHSEVDTLKDDIQDQLAYYLDTEDLLDIKDLIKEEHYFFKCMVNNVQHNYLDFAKQLDLLNQWQSSSSEMFSLLKKDLCRFQNALVRKGVPVDIQ